MYIYIYVQCILSVFAVTLVIAVQVLDLGLEAGVWLACAPAYTCSMHTRFVICFVFSGGLHLASRIYSLTILTRDDPEPPTLSVGGRDRVGQAAGLDL